MAVYLGRCNYDTLSPKRSRNVAVMDRGFADEAVVVVKRGTDEGMVTYLRVKFLDSDKDIGDEGRNMLEVRCNICNHRQESQPEKG